jgi:hypothetical protein
MQTVLLFITTCLLGFYASKFFTTPVFKNGQERPNRLPTLRLWNIEFLPCFRIHVKDSTIWLHHWLYLSIIILGSALLYDNLMHLTSIKVATGASLGGIIQGLTYPDRFKFKHPRIKK